MVTSRGGFRRQACDFSASVNLKMRKQAGMGQEGLSEGFPQTSGVRSVRKREQEGQMMGGPFRILLPLCENP